MNFTKVEWSPSIARVSSIESGKPRMEELFSTALKKEPVRAHVPFSSYRLLATVPHKLDMSPRALRYLHQSPSLSDFLKSDNFHLIYCQGMNEPA